MAVIFTTWQGLSPTITVMSAVFVWTLKWTEIVHMSSMIHSHSPSPQNIALQIIYVAVYKAGPSETLQYTSKHADKISLWSNCGSIPEVTCKPLITLVNTDLPHDHICYQIVRQASGHCCISTDTSGTSAFNDRKNHYSFLFYVIMSLHCVNFFKINLNDCSSYWLMSSWDYRLYAVSMTVVLLKCLFLFCSLNAALQNSSLWENVVLHEISWTLSVCQDHSRWGVQGAKVEGQICLSTWVYNERVHRATETVWYHESGRKPGL